MTLQSLLSDNGSINFADAGPHAYRLVVRVDKNELMLIAHHSWLVALALIRLLTLCKDVSELEIPDESHDVLITSAQSYDHNIDSLAPVPQAPRR